MLTATRGFRYFVGRKAPSSHHTGAGASLWKTLLPERYVVKNKLYWLVFFCACWGIRAEPRPLIEQLYQANQGQLLWYDKHGLSLTAMSLQQLLIDLGPSPTTRTFAKTKHTDKRRDRQLTQKLIDLIDRIALLNQRPADLDRARFLDAIKHQQLADYVDSLLPPYDEVNSLRAMIRHYQVLAQGDWPKLEKKSFRLGQRSPHVSLLRDRLLQLGDLTTAPSSAERRGIFGPPLIASIKRFQQRHGLTPSGNLDDATTASLNVSPKARIKQMQTALWQWFRLPAQLPPRYLWINIPGYQLALYEQGKRRLAMKVIVGKPEFPTPQLHTRLTQFTVNPSWTPPLHIVKNELLPLNQQQPGYLQQQRFELRSPSTVKAPVVDLADIRDTNLLPWLQEYRLVQAPGRENALGRYRFTITNNSAIYLHDTPAKQLFKRQQRSLSHGCIRLESAAQLMRYLLSLESTQITSTATQALFRGETRGVLLSQPLPVFITYHTAWVDGDGELQIRPDIYQLADTLAPFTPAPP